MPGSVMSPQATQRQTRSEVPVISSSQVLTTKPSHLEQLLDCVAISTTNMSHGYPTTYVTGLMCFTGLHISFTLEKDWSELHSFEDIVWQTPQAVVPARRFSRKTGASSWRTILRRNCARATRRRSERSPSCGTYS